MKSSFSGLTVPKMADFNPQALNKNARTAAMVVLMGCFSKRGKYITGC